MKILTAVIVLMVLGGGTAATVATVGNVDWDAWHQQSHHYEHIKYNSIGYKFSNIHTDPELNEEDGLYYSVTKLQIHNKEGKMVFIPSLSHTGNERCEVVEGGTVVYSKFERDGTVRECQTFFPGAYLQGMTVTTYADLWRDADNKREICEKYGIQDEVDLNVRHYPTNGGGDQFKLYAGTGSEMVLIDEDFDYPIETMTVNGILLSETSTVEIQHITETMEECFESVQTTEDLTNAVMFNTSIRIVDSIIDAELVEETEVDEVEGDYY